MLGDMGRLPEHGGMPRNPLDDVRTVWEQQLGTVLPSGHRIQVSLFLRVSENTR